MVSGTVLPPPASDISLHRKIASIHQQHILEKKKKGLSSTDACVGIKLSLSIGYYSPYHSPSSRGLCFVQEVSMIGVPGFDRLGVKISDLFHHNLESAHTWASHLHIGFFGSVVLLGISLASPFLRPCLTFRKISCWWSRLDSNSWRCDPVGDANVKRGFCRLQILVWEYSLFYLQGVLHIRIYRCSTSKNN